MGNRSHRPLRCQPAVHPLSITGYQDIYHLPAASGITDTAPGRTAAPWHAPTLYSCPSAILPVACIVQPQPAASSRTRSSSHPIIGRLGHVTGRRAGLDRYGPDLIHFYCYFIYRTCMYLTQSDSPPSCAPKYQIIVPIVPSRSQTPPVLVSARSGRHNQLTTHLSLLFIHRHSSRLIIGLCTT